MTSLLLDTSVLIKWFHGEGESELDEARLLRTARHRGELDVHVLDLAVYEVGNVLTRALAWAPEDVADQLDDLVTICGAPLALTAQWLRAAALLAGRHDLTFYDASWAAAARGLGVALVSADRKLQSCGLAESPSQVVQRLRLRPGGT